MPVDRVENWRKFSEHMEEYIREHTIEKYTMEKIDGLDLMSISKPFICIWNILRYAVRIWNNRMKEQDIEKIAHYAELAWTLSGGKILRTEEIEEQCGQRGIKGNFFLDAVP